MSKVFFAAFTAMTVLAGYMTVNNVGVMEPGAKQIRAGSVNKAPRVGGGAIRRGK